MLKDAFDWALRLSPQAKTIAIGSACLVVAVAATFLVLSRGNGCYARNDVTVRVGYVAAKLQEAAAQGKIKVERLAEGVRRLNAAAMTYETTKDHSVYCNALDELTGEFKLTDRMWKGFS